MKRVPRPDVRTAIEEELHQRAVPRVEHINERDRFDARAVFDEDFDHVQPLPIDSFGERLVLLLLP